MSHPWELISEKKKGKLAKCWLAATLSTATFYKKFTKSTIDDIDVCQMCDYIENVIEKNNDATYGKCSLHLSSELAYGIVKIFSYKTSNLEKDITNMIEKQSSDTEVKKRGEGKHEKVIDSLDVFSTCSAQLYKDVNLLPNDLDIEINLKNKMNDATCLDFGALTEKEITFINGTDADLLQAFERTHIRNPDVDNGLDLYFGFEKTLPGTEKSNIDMYEDEKKMLISSIYDDIPVEDHVHQVSFAKTMLPELTVQDMESRKSDLLTPQKRQALEKKHTETPSKRRRLRFEDESDVDMVATTLIPEAAVASISATDHPLELPQNLELAQNNSLEVGRKSKKRKVFSDKSTKLSNKIIQKWFNNINAHTLPLNIINVNMPTSEVLFKAPSTNFTFTHERKWNNSLTKLFNMHTVPISEQKTIPMEYEELLEKSTEFTRFEDRSNKTEDQSVLLSILGKTLESSSHAKSAVMELEHLEEVIHPNILQGIDLQGLEENLQTLNIGQPIYPDLKTYEEKVEKHQEAFKSSQPCTITKQDLLAMLEVHWHNTEMVRFTDVIEPDSYDNNDAACCFIFLLELHKENKITLEQAGPYDILWIKKNSLDISEDDSMT